MVVVLRNKVQMIHQPHGLLQTRMQPGAGKEGRLKFLYTLHQTESRCAELSQNPDQLPGIVVSFVSLAIAQVRDGEGVSIRQKVVHTRHPQGLEIEQMASVLLG